jgi:hypothetical protein
MKRRIFGFHFAGLVSEVDTCLEHLSHGDDGHDGDSSSAVDGAGPQAHR